MRIPGGFYINIHTRMYQVKDKTHPRRFRFDVTRPRRELRTTGPSRQAMRTAETRKKLLAAAARIFARDGFEAARLEEIAFSAGYTRGA